MYIQYLSDAHYGFVCIYKFRFIYFYLETVCVLHYEKYTSDWC